MTRLLACLALIAAAPVAPAVFAQTPLVNELASDPGMEAPLCGKFDTLDVDGQIQMLTEVQPLGDEIEAGDRDAARQWAAEVAQACGGRADRPLADAAREALGQ